MLLLLELIPYVTIFLFGIVVGSFLNVCIYRLPEGESIVKVPSHCMSCGAKLRWFDLIPLFSWLFLRGRCRQCKAVISVQYPVVEAVNGILWVAVFLVNGMNGMSVLYSLMASALLTLSVIDWRTFEIPFGINVFLGVLGVVAVFLEKEEWRSHLIGAVCVSGVLFVLYLLSKGRAIGGGDIKLMAVSGLFLGAAPTVCAMFIGLVTGGGYGAYMLISKKLDRKDHFAFGPFLAFGLAVAVFAGDRIAEWYLGML